MYGKIFESLYTGSMIGAGSPTFAVWGYVIANMKPDDSVGAQVELNPELIRLVLGEKREVVEKVIEWLCSPDPGSRSKAEEGRRLMKIGEYSYRVVNGARYMAIRKEEERREYYREAKRKQRAKNLKTNKPLAGENQALAAEKRGDTAEYDRITATPASQLRS